MPPRDRDGLFHHAERNIRNVVMTFENGSRIEIPEAREMSIEEDTPNEMPIASIGTREATFSIEGADLNDMQDLIEEYVAERRREAERQMLAAAFNRVSAESRDAIDALSDAAQLFARAYGVSFIDSLNSVWAAMSDDFELADEEEYVATDPISFDELMGGCCSDN